MRWLVERKRDDFEDIGADSVRIEFGCLVFRNGLSDSEPVYILAAGEWLIIVPGDES